MYKYLYVYTGSEIKDYPIVKYGDIFEYTIDDYFIKHVNSNTHIPVINITNLISYTKQDLRSLAIKLDMSAQSFNDAITALNIHKTIGLPSNDCFLVIKQITLGGITIPLGSIISNVLYVHSSSNHIIKSFTYNGIVVDQIIASSHLFRITVNVNEFDQKYDYYMNLLNRDRNRYTLISNLLTYINL